MRRRITLPSFNAVGAGQTATLDVPLGRLYHGIFIRYKKTATRAQIEADVKEIRVLINGKAQRRYSAAQLFTMLDMIGYSFQAGIIPIFFSEPNRRTIDGEEGLAWGTADIATFQIEIDIASTATAPTLSAFAEVGIGNKNLGLIIKHRIESFDSQGAQVKNITGLPKRDIYQRMYVFSSLVTAARVEVDQLCVYDLTRDDAVALMARPTPKLTMPTGTFVICFDDTQQVTDGLPMARNDGQKITEFRVDLTCSGAGALPIISETLGFAD